MLLPCAVEQGDPFSFGMYLKRSWLHPTDVLFMYTGSKFSTGADEDKNRISVSGDPSSHALNVTISQLKASDTDRYYCEFVVENPAGEDLLLLGKTEFFLLVRAGECFFPFHKYFDCLKLNLTRLNFQNLPHTLHQKYISTFADDSK